MADSLYLLKSCVKKKEIEMVEDGRLPWVHGCEGADPEELR